MTANAQPRFTTTPNVNSVLVTAARTTSDGSGGTVGTDMFLAFTAGASGSYVDFVVLLAVASAAATATNATVIRIYISTINTGSTTTANTWCIKEIPIASQTADQAAAAINEFPIPLGFQLPANYTILLSTGTANATNTAWRGTVFGGDF